MNNNNVWITDAPFSAQGIGGDDTAAIKLAIAAVAAVGGGTVYVPMLPFGISSMVQQPQGVVLQGVMHGPFEPTAAPTGAKTCNAPTILFLTPQAGIQLMGPGAKFLDIQTYYTGQVLPSAAAPIPFPPTVSMPYGTDGGCSVERCTFINSYDAISVSVGRCEVKDNRIGAFRQAITYDGPEDYIIDRGNLIEPFWDFIYGDSPTQPIDAWVLTHGVGYWIGRCDAFNISDFGIFSRNTAFRIGDSLQPVPAGQCTASYGEIHDGDGDTVSVGTIATATNNIGGGVQLKNVRIGANMTGLGQAPQGSLLALAGGSAPPMIQWDGGAVRGTWTYGNGIGGLQINAGETRVTNVKGINPVGPLPALPFPESGQPIKNPWPVKLRIFIAGGSISALAINGSTFPFSGPVSVTLDVGESLAVTYTGAPHWAWFGE